MLAGWKTLDIPDYRPIERRRPGRPLKRLQEGYNHEAEIADLLA